MANVVVLGSGGWGTALGVMAHRHGHNVTLWSPFEEEIVSIREHSEHRKLLPGVPVPQTIDLTTDISCVSMADLILVVVPSFAVRSTAISMKPYLKSDTLIAVAAKGLDDSNFKCFTEILEEELPGGRIAAISGPSHAEEVGRGVPTSVVSASKEEKTAKAVQDILMSPDFRVYTSCDDIGVQLGGALKNVIAFCAGICDGLQMGDNTKAALMTRGLAEMKRLGEKMGANAETFSGLSGMGDLIVTCGSMHSRNRRAGILIGQGQNPDDAVKTVGTVEGYLVLKTAYNLAKKMNVEMPITEACYRVCYEGESPRLAIEQLMQRPKKSE